MLLLCFAISATVIPFPNLQLAAVLLLCLNWIHKVSLMHGCLTSGVPKEFYYLHVYLNPISRFRLAYIDIQLSMYTVAGLIAAILQYVRP